ncbi:MAG: hypothetical protein K2G60_05480 [Oscillospiraceae bacterium]|nr:hypothetical protein [Oscillospiraceae bacterium]
MIIWGYIITAFCFVLTFLLAITVYKIAKHNEISRKIIHIVAGVGWLVFWFFFQDTIHPFIISLVFVIVTVITNVKQVKFVELEKSNYGTVFFTASMAIMALLSYIYPSYLFSFGVAIVSLSIGDGMASIIGEHANFMPKKLFGNKTLVGTVACTFFTFVAIVGINCICGTQLNILNIIILSAITGLVELFSGKYDNITIPFCAFFLSHMMIYG